MTDSIFSLILFICVLISGIVTLLDIFIFSKRPKDLLSIDSDPDSDNDKKKEKQGFVANVRSVFPILLIVFIIRSFLFAPFKIPSGSMIPTLKVGDYIIVSKHAYDVRFPFFNIKLWKMEDLKRGDIVVFSSTPEFKEQNGKKEDLIKRLVGLPGDEIRYEGKNLYINGKLVSKTFVSSVAGDYDPTLGGAYSYNVYQESFGPKTFQVQNYPDAQGKSGQWTVPPNMYFMMGDNRDLSDDSRFWGFVPRDHVIGRAILIWMHWPSLTTLPSFKYNRFL